MKTLATAEQRARKIVNDWAIAATGISWIPGSGLFLGAADWVMIQQVADEFGVYSYSKEGVLGVVSGSLAGKMAVEALSVVPIVGWAAKTAVAGTITKGMGEVVIAYFKARSPLQ